MVMMMVRVCVCVCDADDTMRVCVCVCDADDTMRVCVCVCLHEYILSTFHDSKNVDDEMFVLQTMFMSCYHTQFNVKCSRRSREKVEGTLKMHLSNFWIVTTGEMSLLIDGAVCPGRTHYIR